MKSLEFVAAVIAKSPDIAFKAKKGSICQHLILEMGLANCFAAESPVQTVFSPNHETHWLFITRYCGFRNLEENGYSVCAYPKSKFSAVEAGEAFHQEADSPLTFDAIINDASWNN